MRAGLPSLLFLLSFVVMGGKEGEEAVGGKKTTHEFGGRRL